MPEETFKVAVVARMKHGVLYEAIKKRGWSVKKAAEFLGIRWSHLCSIINLRKKPPFIFSQKQNDETKRKARELTEKLMELTGMTVEDLFPEAVRTDEFFNQPKVFERTAEVPLDKLIGYRETLALPPAPDEELMDREQEEALEGATEIGFQKLSSHEQKIITLRFFENQTLEKVGKEFGLTRENIRQKQNTALAKMRREIEKKTKKS